MPNYEVLHGRAGIFPKGHVFSMAQFVAVHPHPKTHPGDEPQKTDHGALIQRLIDLEAIRVTDAHEQPMPAEATVPPKPKNDEELAKEKIKASEDAKLDATIKDMRAKK